MAVRILFRRGTAQRWIDINPILAQGEMGIELDTSLRKIGDGVTAWVDLPYADRGETGPQGPQGIQGEMGPQGPQGEVGPPGPNEASLIEFTPEVGGQLTAINVQDALYELDGLTHDLDLRLDNITNPLLLKGNISLPSHFPLLADVQNGWFYKITADVTDNDVSKTNTGLSFSNGEDIAWDGSSWIVVGIENEATRILFTPDVGHIDSTDVQHAIEEVESHVDYLRDITEGNGVISGLALSINATTFNISSGPYHAISSHEPKVFPGASNIPQTYLLTHIATYVAINPVDDSIIQKSSPFTPAERRSYIILGAVIHSNKTTNNAVNNLPDVAVKSLSQQMDFYDCIGNFNKSGNIFSPNGANLKLNKSVGQIFKRGVGFQSDPNSPNMISLSSLTAPTNLRYRLSNGTESADISDVPLKWESAPGVESALTGGQYSVLRIFIFPSNLARIQLGRVTYNSMANALQGFTHEFFEPEQNLKENGLLRSYLIVKGGTTDLTDTTKANFIEADRFGAFPIGGASGTASLQQAYNNSVQPEILTDSERGAVTFQRGSASDTDDVVEVKNGAGTKVANISGEGKIVGKNVEAVDNFIANNSPGTTKKVLHGNEAGKSFFSEVVEDDILLSDVSTNNATTDRHGLLPKLSGVGTQFLNGQGNWQLPAGASLNTSYTSLAFTNQTSVTLTHGFGAFPIIQVIDNTGAVLIPLTIVNTSVNQVTVTFITSTSGTIIASLGAPQPSNITVVNSDYDIVASDRIIQASTPGIEITMPDATNFLGFEFVVDNASLGKIKVLPQLGQTISGEIFQILDSDNAMQMYSNGVNWRII